MAFRSSRRAGIAWTTLAIAAMVAAAAPRGVRAADPPSHLAGTWTLDREQSEFPSDIGFDMPFAGVVASPTATSTSTGRGRGGRQGGGSSTPGMSVANETEQTLKITADVTDEAAHPWTTLVISVNGAEVTIGDGADVTRHFRPGKSDEQRLADGGITTRAKWDKATLDVDYDVEKDRDVLYTYAAASPNGPLTVTVSFRDHSRGGIVTRRYRKITPGVPENHSRSDFHHTPLFRVVLAHSTCRPASEGPQAPCRVACRVVRPLDNYGAGRWVAIRRSFVMKRQVFGVLAGVMAASALIAAQATSTPPPQTDKATADLTVTGCLTQGSSPAVFILDNARQKVDDKTEKAQSYVVIAAGEDLPLAANLNHEVSVMGSPSAAMAPAAGQKATEKDLPRFSAKTLTSVADRCTAVTR